jgi:hypothetical protein
MPGTHKRGVRASRSKARRSPKITRTIIPTLETTLSRGAKRNLIAGVAAVAAGAAITGAIVMRLRIGQLAKAATKDAVSIGHSVGSFGHRVGKSLGRDITELDLARLLTYAGLKRRPSLARRLLPPMGALAALAFAGGSALFLVRSNRGEADGDAPLRGSKVRVPSTVKADTIGDSASNTIHNSVSSAIDEVKAEVSHAIK